MQRLSAGLHGIRSIRAIALAAIAGWVATSSLAAQAIQSTWEVAGVPALNYDADEGFGYGAIVELYNHVEGALPYRFTVQPTLFLTTGGRRDLTLFIDAPHLRRGWRLGADLGVDRQLAAPYYGPGNEAARNEGLEDQNPQYYRFGRTRQQGAVTFQRILENSPLRLLVGMGVARVTVDPTPKDASATLLSQTLGSRETAPAAWSNHLRVGVVWDTRDREVGPGRGTWSDFLVQRFDDQLGSDTSFTRWTLTDRRYFALMERLVFANRFLVQHATGRPSFYDLYVVQTSFKQQEGLGGAKTLRGVPKNRYSGRTMFIWNPEVRWRAVDFRLLGREASTVLSAFVDSGRVWDNDFRARDLWSDLHHGVGGGARLGFGETFVVAVDVGHSSETQAAVYIGIGYLF